MLSRGPRQIDVEDRLHFAGGFGHDCDPIGEEDGFVDRVGDEQDRLLRLSGFPDAEKLGLEELAGLCVQCRERFVEDEDLRLVGEHTGDGDALTHTARELMRQPICGVLETHRLQYLGCALATFGFGDAANLEADLDVLLRSEPGEQSVSLEYDSDVLVDPGDTLAVDEYSTAVVCLEAGEDVQECGLAATAGTEKREELTLLDPEVEAVEDRGGLLSRSGLRIELGDSFRLDLPFRGGGGLCSDRLRVLFGLLD